MASLDNGGSGQPATYFTCQVITDAVSQQTQVCQLVRSRTHRDHGKQRLWLREVRSRVVKICGNLLPGTPSGLKGPRSESSQ
jgi:hypothetical protein